MFDIHNCNYFARSAVFFSCIFRLRWISSRFRLLSASRSLRSFISLFFSASWRVFSSFSCVNFNNKFKKNYHRHLDRDKLRTCICFLSLSIFAFSRASRICCTCFNFSSRLRFFSSACSNRPLRISSVLSLIWPTLLALAGRLRWASFEVEFELLTDDVVLGGREVSWDEWYPDSWTGACWLVGVKCLMWP